MSIKADRILGLGNLASAKEERLRSLWYILDVICTIGLISRKTWRTTHTKL